MPERYRTIGEDTGLPPLDGMENGHNEWEPSPVPLPDSETNSEAPYGYKADGTPRAKPGRKPGSGGGSGSGTRKAFGSSDAAFGSRISDELIELSAPLAIVSPMAMAHVARRADKTAMALVNVSKKHPRVKLAINAYFDSVSYKDLVLFVLGIPIMVMIDYRMLRPDSKIGIPWHAQEIYQECYQSEGSEQQPEAAGYRGLAGQI